MPSLIQISAVKWKAGKIFQEIETGVVPMFYVNLAFMATHYIQYTYAILLHHFMNFFMFLYASKNLIVSGCKIGMQLIKLQL